MSPLKAALQYAAVLLTLLVAFFYYFGYLYYSNRLAYWGLTTNMFPLSKEETIIVGAIQLTSVTLKMIADNVVLFVSIAILVILAVIISCIRKLRDYLGARMLALGRRVRGLRHHVVITDNHEKTINVMQSINISLIIVLLVVFIVAICSQRVVIQANNDSKKQHAQIVANKPSDIPFSSKAVLSIKNDTKVLDTYSSNLIQTSATHCALYSPAKGVMIFQLSNISRMIIHESKQKN